MKLNENLKQDIINDFQSILNKRMIMIFALLFIIYTISDMGAVFFLIPLCFALIPFKRDEYHNIKIPDQNSEMIKARYIYALLLLLAVILISFVTSNIASMFSASSIDLIPVDSIILMIIIFLITAGLLLPIFYKYGFKKGQYALYILVIAFAIINLYQSRIPALVSIQEMIKTNQWYIVTSIGFLIGGLFFIGSYFISNKMVVKK
jgi:ABC-2 type transport system permease protein